MIHSDVVVSCELMPVRWRGYIREKWCDADDWEREEVPEECQCLMEYFVLGDGKGPSSLPYDVQGEREDQI